VGVGLLSVWLALSAAGQAPGPAAGTPPSSPPALRDLELTWEARQALLKDQRLASLNVGVTVRQRVATLWGSIPTADLARLAEDLVRQVPSLVEVRSEWQIEQAAGAKTRSFALPAGERPAVPDTPLAGPFQAPAALVGRPSEAGPAPGRDLAWRPGRTAPISLPPTPPRMGGPDPIAVRGRAGPAATLGPPIVDPGWKPGGSSGTARPAAQVAAREAGAEPPRVVAPLPAGPGSRGPIAVLLPPERPPTAADLGQTIESLRQQNGRLSRLVPEVRGGLVYVRGTVSRWEDLFDFARTISLLPGVERVILEAVQARPQGSR
jgi:hypothetical protein